MMFILYKDSIQELMVNRMKIILFCHQPMKLIEAQMFYLLDS